MEKKKKDNNNKKKRSKIKEKGEEKDEGARVDAYKRKNGGCEQWLSRLLIVFQRHTMEKP